MLGLRLARAKPLSSLRGIDGSLAHSLNTAHRHAPPRCGRPNVRYNRPQIALGGCRNRNRRLQWSALYFGLVA
jgi:hypothetical protein